MALALGWAISAQTDLQAEAGFVPPQLMQEVRAEYPQEAQGASAVVTLTLVVSSTGAVTVQSARVESEDGVLVEAAFERSAMEAASRLRFRPASEAGAPVPVVLDYVVRFEPPAPSPPSERSGPSAANFVGRITERGTRRPLPGALVTVIRDGPVEEAYEDVSDEEGRYQFFDLGSGAWTLRIDLDGYFSSASTETVVEGEVVAVDVKVERRSYNPYDVLVEGERVEKEVTRRTLRRADIERIPGQLSDAVRVVETLPGVARPPAGSGDIIVRGSGPADTGVFVDGLQIPTVFHFVGLRSIIPTEFVDQVDFTPGNFSAYYGRFTGGVFDIELRTLEPEQVTGSVDISLLDAGLVLEVPVGEQAAVGFGFRRSTIDLVFGAVTDAADLSVQTPPVYYDAQILANYRPSPAHLFKLAVFGADDGFAADLDNPAEFGTEFTSGNSELSARFGRARGEYTFTPGEGFRSETSLALGIDQNRFSFGGLFDIDTEDLIIQGRQQVEFQVAEWLRVAVGADVEATRSVGTVVAGRPDREGDPTGDDASEPLATDFDEWANNLSGYLEAVVEFGPLTLVPGLRVDYFGRLEALTLDPRIVAKYQWSEAWVVKAGVGLTHQAPQLVELDEVFGNPALSPFRATQVSGGVEWRPLPFFRIEATGFFKVLDDVVVSSSRLIGAEDGFVPEVLANDGRGRIYGFELFVDHQFNANFRGWLSYTLSRAERQDGLGEAYRLFDFDQTHILSAQASYQLPKNWEVGARIRLVSGNPSTPFTGGVFFSDNDEYFETTGLVNSERLPLFNQFDIRVDKRWIFDEWTLSAYLSLTNALNTTNAEGRSYNFDFTERADEGGLPIYPIFGLRGDF